MTDHPDEMRTVDRHPIDDARRPADLLIPRNQQDQKLNWFLNGQLDKLTSLEIIFLEELQTSSNA